MCTRLLSILAAVYTIAVIVQGVYHLMVDYQFQCYDGMWVAEAVLAVLVLLVFSLGTMLSIVWVLNHNIPRADRTNARKLLEGPYNPENPTFKRLGVLYAVYRPELCYFEVVQMTFKILVWCLLVFLDDGGDEQLAIALVVNVVQLCVHIYCQPFYGDNAWLLNLQQTAVLVTTTYTNFGGFYTDHLQQVRLLLGGTSANEGERDRIDERLGLVSGLMEALFAATLLAFALPMASTLRRKWQERQAGGRRSFLASMLERVDKEVRHRKNSVSSERDWSSVNWVQVPAVAKKMAEQEALRAQILREDAKPSVDEAEQSHFSLSGLTDKLSSMWRRSHQATRELSTDLGRISADIELQGIPDATVHIKDGDGAPQATPSNLPGLPEEFEPAPSDPQPQPRPQPQPQPQP